MVDKVFKENFDYRSVFNITENFKLNYTNRSKLQ